MPIVCVCENRSTRRVKSSVLFWFWKKALFTFLWVVRHLNWASVRAGRVFVLCIRVEKVLNKL